MLLPPPPPIKDGRLLLAREPVLDRRSRLVGYQIRVGHGAGERPSDDARSLAGVFDREGFDALRHGRSAFVTVSRQCLVESVPEALSPECTVLDVPAALHADREVERACAAARERGYRLSIADFTITAPAAPLAAQADYLKVDAAGPMTAEARARLVACFASAHTTLIATGVHSLDQWQMAAQDGFTCFQGYFFGRPLLAPAAGRRPSANHVPLLRLLRVLNDPELSTGRLEDIVKHDPALCYRLLRTVNSAASTVRAEVTSIGEALLLLGRDTVRRWASLWIVAGLNAEAHSELVVMSAVRARLCETVVTAARGPSAGSEAFLLGMCSLLDTLLGRPMRDVVAELPLGKVTRGALCGEPGPLRDTLECVVAYERGAWRDSEALAIRASVDPAMLPGAFVEALRWSREFQTLGPQDTSERPAGPN